MAHFEIEKRDLLKGLSLMQGIAGRRTTLPILSHILLEWKENSLFLTGTDLQTGIQEEINGIVHEDGRASVSSKKLFEIVRELPEQTIHISKKENHWIQIKCGKSLFNLAGLDPDDYPSLPLFKESSLSPIPIPILREMIEKTAFAASNEESRYHLHGVLLIQQKSGGREVFRMVATDGHRLALIDREGQVIRGIEKGVIIPKKGVLEIKKILGEKEGEEEMGIYVDSTHAFLKWQKSLMVLRLIEGEFPEYDQVIPKQNDKIIRMGRETLYESLKRVSTMVSERAEGVKLSIQKNSMELSSHHQDYGDAQEEINIQYDGPSFEISFNARYLIEALQSFDTEEIVMELKDEGSPGLLRPHLPPSLSQQLSIIMPMRL